VRECPEAGDRKTTREETATGCRPITRYFVGPEENEEFRRFRVVGPLVIAAAIAVSCATPLAQGPSAEDSLALYENLLRNPDDISANLAYARALEADWADRGGQANLSKNTDPQPE